MEYSRLVKGLSLRGEAPVTSGGTEAKNLPSNILQVLASESRKYYIVPVLVPC